MRPPRKRIPKRVFQAVSLPLLFGVWGLAACMVRADVAPVPWLVDHVGVAIGWTLVWVAASVVWIVVVLPFRLNTDFATLDEVMEERGVTSVWDLLGSQRAWEAKVLTEGTLGERRRLLLLQALIAFVVGAVCAVATAVNFDIAPDDLFLLPPIACVVSVAMSAWYLVRAAIQR
jgi:hypothetical protein